MRRVILIIFYLLCAFLVNADATKLKGAYLGQKTPGNVAEVFAKGIISKKDSVEFSITMSPDGREIYFTRRKEGVFDNRIFCTKLKNGVWTKPELTIFAGDVWANEPHITPDGKKIYFGSKLPLDKKTKIAKRPGIWMAEKTEDGFGKAKFFESGLMYVTVSNKGTMYVTDKSSSWPFIVKKHYINGKYGKSEKLTGPDKQFYAAWHPYIAKDESFIIFEQIGRKNNTLVGDDLFISFKDKNGKWTKVKNLGNKINSKYNDFCPYISPDGKYLFFTRENEKKDLDIYWVSTDFIKKLKAELKNK